MTATYVQANRTTTLFMNGSDFTVVLNGGSFTTANDAIAMSNAFNTTLVSGLVASESGAAIRIVLGASENRVTVDEGGMLVMGGTNGGSALISEGTDTTIANAGVISGIYGVAATKDSTDFDLHNTGRIFGTHLDGVNIESTNADITNTGDIIGDRYGVGAGVFGNLERFSLSNAGTISGATAVVVDQGTDHQVQNSGTLIGGAFSFFGNNKGTLELENSGQMMGSAVFGTGDDTVTNTGTLSGEVELRNGGDRFNNFGGTVTGNLLMGEGVDIYDGQGGGIVGGVVFGGPGSDVYWLDMPTTRISENPNEGTDSVLSFFDFRLGANFENLALQGTGDLRGIGNTERNLIVGNTGNNLLDGGRNNDTMTGGDGDDIYHVRAPGDTVNENADEGIDTVRAFRSYLLADNVENLHLQTTVAINGIGNEEGNEIVGNMADNVIIGREGNDLLRGQGGADTFVFDRGLNATTNVDTILDFESGVDVLKLKGSVFGFPAAGNLPSGSLRFDTEAQDLNDRIIYDQDTGRMWFDGNGAAAGGQTLFAILTPDTALRAADFEVF
jgi:Ca2+-binding RTX toxin-like protein